MQLAVLVLKDPTLRKYVQNSVQQLRLMNGPGKIYEERELEAFYSAGVLGGLNFALRIAQARADAKESSERAAPSDLEALQLHAWVGEDEYGSGEIGIKQGVVPAGTIPLVAIRRDKIEKVYPQMEAQAKVYRKKIRLCLFRFVKVLRETEHGQ
jgi:hypothetical protein